MFIQFAIHVLLYWANSCGQARLHLCRTYVKNACLFALLHYVSNLYSFKTVNHAFPFAVSNDKSTFLFHLNFVMPQIIEICKTYFMINPSVVNMTISFY